MNHLAQPTRQITRKRFISSRDNRIYLYGVTWETFKTLQSGFTEIKGVKLTYFTGLLEIMSTLGEKHENVKRTLNLLLETYMREIGIRFYARGGFALEKIGYASIVPDDSYCIGTRKVVPDLVIEVVITSGSLKKLELYKLHEIPEVWFWKSSKLKVFRYHGGDYQEESRSLFFPELDLNLLERHIEFPDQYEAVQKFQEMIRQQT